MTKFVAFLRGINVGGRIVKMTELTACCEGIGLKQVRTVLQTGNILFESDHTADELKTMLESALTQTFSYPARVYVYSYDWLERVVASFPLPTGNPVVHNYVIFTEHLLTTRLQAQGYTCDPLETVVIAGDVIYWNVPKGMTLKSQFARQLNKAAYKNDMTVRNLQTLKKLI